jgi:hypothetical protein
MDIATTLATAKGATDLVSSILATSKNAAVAQKAAELTSVIISLQSDIMAMQSEYQAMLQELDSWKEKAQRRASWEETKLKYELFSPSEGSFVFAPTEASGCGEPGHWLCANCFNREIASFLQLKAKKSNGFLYQCQNKDCSAEVWDRSNKVLPPTRSANRRGANWGV